MATNPLFSSYDPVPFTINLPARVTCQEITEIPATSSLAAALTTYNANFTKLQSCVNHIWQWMDTAFDYKNGPLGVLNLHSDVDYAVPPKQFDVLAFVNNQWTNVDLLQYGNISMTPMTLNQLIDVEHAPVVKPGQALVYDPARAYAEQTDKRNNGVPDVNGFVYYDDGTPIPSAANLQYTNPNAPYFVQPFITRFLELSDLNDVATSVSVGASPAIMYYDPTDTAKAPERVAGLWKSLGSPIGTTNKVLSVDFAGVPQWVDMSAGGVSNLLELGDVSPQLVGVSFGLSNCTNPNILEYDQRYDFLLQNPGSGYNFQIKRNDSTVTWKLASNFRRMVCDNEQYNVYQALDLTAPGAMIVVSPFGQVNIIVS